MPQRTQAEIHRAGMAMRKSVAPQSLISKRHFDDASVRDIRKRAAAGEDIKMIALDYDANAATLRSMIRGETYKDVP